MREQIVIDAEGAITGRLAAYVAKQALLGKEVIVVNAEKAVISGRKDVIINKYLRRRQLGRRKQKGPYWPCEADRLLRRITRGMLPWKKARGKEAFKRIKCYKGIPETIDKEKIIKLQNLKNLKKDLMWFISLSELEKLLKGGRIK